ncbi:hypothetical protein PTKIN_Ptkin09bG0285600 [Pterospermum kingtungense]
MATSNLSKIVVLALVCMSSINSCSSTNDNTTPPPKFPAILIFGDSTVDAGNNNYIRTFFKGNNAPYGENYPGHVPTGRFSDGKLVPDFLASSLGIKEAVPPFLDPNLSDDELRTGVNFASAGSGFDDLTTLLSGVIPVSRQVELFKSYIEKLKGIVGEEEANKIIGEALVVISAGTNDFVFNFFDIPSRLLQFGNSGYQSFLLQRIEEFVEELYDLGCRKIIVAGVPPIGCLPIQMTLRLENPNHFTCLEDQNSVARSYNNKLRRLLADIQVELPKSKIADFGLWRQRPNVGKWDIFCEWGAIIIYEYVLVLNQGLAFGVVIVWEFENGSSVPCFFEPFFIRGYFNLSAFTENHLSCINNIFPPWRGAAFLA